MSKVVSIRLPEETEARLQRLARRLGKTPSETGAMLIEESLRETEFAYIEFRNSPVGRQAYLKNSNLAVWQVMMLAEQYHSNDEIILKAASVEKLTFITYDQQTIPPILIEWGQANIHHAGIVFIDYRSIAPNHFAK